jgi:hemerythrin
MRSDHKIKYFAAPVVRASVRKKLSALTTIAEEKLNNYFEVHDLETGIWTEVDGMEVKPIFSPHPIETTVFIFRALCNEGYRTYAHLADIASLDILKSMINDNVSEPGLTQDLYSLVRDNYLKRADLKKLDVGGGLVHGDAADFQGDKSGKIILSHTESELTNRQKEIGSGTSFGMVDVLIPSNQDYLWQYAFLYMQSHFPNVPHHQINMLLNNPVVTFNAESIIVRKDEINRNIFFVLTGYVEVIRSGSGFIRKMSSGGIVGDNSGLSGSMSKETYRAVSFVQALRLPCHLYLDFIKRNGLYDDIMNLQEKREFLQNTWLFSEEISYPVQNRLARTMTLQSYPDEKEIPKEERSGIHIVKQGKLEIYINEDVFETVHAGNFIGSGNVLLGTLSLFQVRALKNTEVYYIPRDTILEIPIVYWKLLEIYEKRMRMILNPDLISIPIFQWRDEYSINVSEMDNDHKRLFEISNMLYEAINSDGNRSEMENILNLIINHTGQHFDREEDLMEKYNFPERNIQHKQHELFRETVLEYKRKFKSNEIEIDMHFINLLKDWVINHILTEDRKYGIHLNREGVF